ncbi:hypothetical protein OPV22_005593 [Ensete ventricosum]|uniref:mitogen-activated protein kinase kinase kinase n=1 Tax=Ensete ventricosum TaxID=4639 RepID=A0AAV8RJG1_ENSVE|nr:hypothetical protein OPV22_005593 [Ensete ventricosum]
MRIAGGALIVVLGFWRLMTNLLGEVWFFRCLSLVASADSEDVKKNTKENFIDTLHRFISSTEEKSSTKSRGSRRRKSDTSKKVSGSRTESRSTSPSAQVSRCQSFGGRTNSQPLPLPGLRSGISYKPSEVITSKSTLEERGKSQLLLPLPRPNHFSKRPDTAELDGGLATASISSNCSIDSDDAADSELHSPVNDFLKSNRAVTSNHSAGHKDPCPATQCKTREMMKSTNFLLRNHILSSPSKQGCQNNYQSNIQLPRHGAFASAPDSSLSSPSRSPMRVVFPDQIPTSAIWVTKPQQDLTFFGSGQCSSPGSGQTSGHNSMGGDMLGQFWQHSRGSPECSPIPSPRMLSPGPSSRIHSGTVSPLHPRAVGTAPESPTRRHDEGKKESHRLPLPPKNISISATFPPHNTTTNSSMSIIRSPGRTDNPTSPGSKWKKGKLIGRGTFGHVYIGFNSESGEMCAMKEVTLFMDDAKSKESAKQLGQEISLLSRLQHPNIVQYYGCEMIDDKLYIYLEYVSGGSIHKLLQEYGPLGEPAIRSYTQQILSGLAYLHAKNTVHRDIKGANILVDPNGRVKLADFGMAKHITGQSCPLSFKGSPYWMAPEVIKNSNGCNLAVDVWSLGCTVLEMVTSKPPWSQYEGIAAMFKIGNSKELPPIPDHLSVDGKDFIGKCLQRDPSKRPTASELLQHPFVNSAALIEKSIFSSQPVQQLIGVSSGACTKLYNETLVVMTKPQGVGHARNLASLDVEGLAFHRLRGGKYTILSSNPARYISCPVSPIGSPLLNSRSPQHISGRMSPSPISSPMATSGASTPLTGGNGAVPFNQLKQVAYLHDGHRSSSRSMNGCYPSGAIYHEPKVDLFLGMQHMLPRLGERRTSETDTLSIHVGRVGHDNTRDPCESHRFLSDHMSYQILRDQMTHNPSVDLRSGSSMHSCRNGT